MSKRNGSRGESGKEASALRSIHICVCVLVNILNHDNNTMTEGGVANGVPNVLHDRVGGGTEGDQDRVGPRRTEAYAVRPRVPIRAPRGPQHPRWSREDIGRSKSRGECLPL